MFIVIDGSEKENVRTSDYYGPFNTKMDAEIWVAAHTDEYTNYIIMPVYASTGE